MPKSAPHSQGKIDTEKIQTVDGIHVKEMSASPLAQIVLIDLKL